MRLDPDPIEEFIRKKDRENQIVEVCAWFLVSGLIAAVTFLLIVAMQ